MENVMGRAEAEAWGDGGAQRADGGPLRASEGLPQEYERGRGRGAGERGGEQGEGYDPGGDGRPGR